MVNLDELKKISIIYQEERLPYRSEVTKYIISGRQPENLTDVIVWLYLVSIWYGRMWFESNVTENKQSVIPDLKGQISAKVKEQGREAHSLLGIAHHDILSNDVVLPWSLHFIKVVIQMYSKILHIPNMSEFLLLTSV